MLKVLYKYLIINPQNSPLKNINIPPVMLWEQGPPGGPQGGARHHKTQSKLSPKPHVESW